VEIISQVLVTLFFFLIYVDTTELTWPSARFTKYKRIGSTNWKKNKFLDSNAKWLIIEIVHIC